MELVETQTYDKETDELLKVTTSVTVTDDELARLRHAVMAQASVVAAAADTFNSDEQCKAEIARWVHFDTKLRNARIRIARTTQKKKGT